MHQVRRPPYELRACHLLVACVAAIGALGCNGGAGSDRSAGPPPGSIGARAGKPDGSGDYFVDPHQGGGASRLRLVELTWGRMVDVHGLDAAGGVDPKPVFRDLVIDENVTGTSADYALETNAITQRTRLVVQRVDGAPEPTPGAGDFTELVRRATANLAPIQPKNDDGSSPEPFSFLARNAALVLRFDDLLGDDADAERLLQDTVRVLVGYPPTAPFIARKVFDRNHGGVLDGAFHSTRVLLDLTVSEAEAAAASTVLPVNSLGLPASLASTGQPNVSVRLPSKADPGSGQFNLLRSVTGSPLASTSNGPVDPSSPTLDVVRALRGGNGADTNNGFLVDLEPPELLGGWPMSIDRAFDDPGGEPGVDFLCDLRFTTVCRVRPEAGDVLSVGAGFFEVSSLASAPDPQGLVSGVQLRNLGATPLTNPAALLGLGLYRTTYDQGAGVPAGCWIGFAPLPGTYPTGSVAPNSQLIVRFSEPIDPESVQPFESVLVAKGPAGSNPSATSTVVASVSPSGDLREYLYSPVVPLEHRVGVAEIYQLLLKGGPAGITDLGGNALLGAPGPIEFLMDAAAPEERTGGFVLRFDSTNEYTKNDPDPGGNNDLRGQFFYDFSEGRIRTRPPTRLALTADRQSSPVTGLMFPFSLGVQTPLAPLGSKLQVLWRYVDFGWIVDDESKMNLDVEGVAWSPVGGLVLSDFYPDFEVRLSHSSRIPDEYIDPTSRVPARPASGLIDKPGMYTDNVLVDPVGPQKVVHAKPLGYRFSATDLYSDERGVPLVPFPMNAPGLPYQSYTWRDTAVLAQGGLDGLGVPLQVETAPPLLLYGPNGVPGSYAKEGEVPASALPLLLEVRCYPNSTSLGLNAFDVSFAVNSSAEPNFRVFSTGGVNTSGTVIRKDPDLELIPSGGFNPRSTPPGKATFRTGDNTFYHGQLSLVIRVSRAHSVWFEAGTNPDYFTPILDPDGARQPTGTSVRMDFRGAVSFTGTGGSEFAAERLDPYGDVDAGTVQFLNGVDTWSSSIDSVDGAPYLQFRLSFFNDVSNGLSPDLSAVGIAYVER